MYRIWIFFMILDNALIPLSDRNSVSFKSLVKRETNLSLGKRETEFHLFLHVLHWARTNYFLTVFFKPADSLFEIIKFIKHFFLNY